MAFYSEGDAALVLGPGLADATAERPTASAWEGSV